MLNAGHNLMLEPPQQERERTAASGALAPTVTGKLRGNWVAGDGATPVSVRGVSLPAEASRRGVGASAARCAAAAAGSCTGETASLQRRAMNKGRSALVGWFSPAA